MDQETVKFDIYELNKSEWFACSAIKDDCNFSCDHDGLLLDPESQYIDPIVVEKHLALCVWNDDSAGLISLSHEIRKKISVQADLTGNAASSLQESVDQSITSRLLHFACKLDSVECAAALLNGECGLKANISNVDGNGRTPLHNAAKEHSIRCIQLLLEKAARTDSRSKDNSALIPLEVALLSERLRVDWTPNETVERLLYLLKEKDLSAVRLLMVRTRELPKVVFITAMEGRVVALAVLLMVDADRVNALKMLPTATTLGLCEESTVYECVIREAIALGRTEVEQVGLSSCRANAASSMNWSEKRKALLCEMELLQLFGAVVRGSCTGRTASPLISACKAGDEAVMILLLKAKIDVNETDKDGNSAIHWCLSASPYSNDTRFRLVSLLLRHGARVSQKNKLGLTPVHVAAGNGNFQVLQLFLLCDPNCVDVTSETKETPLFFAVKSNSMECVQLLLSYGANTQSLNLRKERPIDLTKSQDMRFILNTTNLSFWNHVVPIQETDIDTYEGFVDAKHVSCDRVFMNAKTELCRYYGSPSGCARGTKCYFAHGDAELSRTKSGSAELKLGLSSQAIAKNLSRTSRISEDPNKKIFIGGLPPSVESDDLRVYFEKEFGAVEDAVVIGSQAGDHVQSRGFGFVTFESDAAAAAAVGAHFVNIFGKKVEIKGAVPKVVSFHELPKTSRQQQEEHQHVLNSNAKETKDEGRQEPMSCVEKIIANGMQTTKPDIQMFSTQNIPQWLETFKRWLPSFLTEVSKRLREGECYPLSSLKGDFRATCGMELDHASLGCPKLSDFMRSFSGICRMKIVPVGKGPATHMVLLPSRPRSLNQPHLETQNLFKESKSKPFYDYASLPVRSCNFFACTRSWCEMGNEIDASFPACPSTVYLDNDECAGSGDAESTCGQGDSEAPSSFSVDPRLLSFLEPGYCFLRPWHTPSEKTGGLGPWKSSADVPFSYFAHQFDYRKYLRDSSICRACNKQKALWAGWPCKHKLLCTHCKNGTEISWKHCFHCSEPVERVFYAPWGNMISDGLKHSTLTPACSNGSESSFPPLCRDSF